MREVDRLCGYSLGETSGIGQPVENCPPPYRDPLLTELESESVSPAVQAMDGKETSYGDYDPREAAAQAQDR